MYLRDFIHAFITALKNPLNILHVIVFQIFSMIFSKTKSQLTHIPLLGTVRSNSKSSEFTIQLSSYHFTKKKKIKINK